MATPSHQPKRPSAGDPSPAGPLRVLLVGRTGLDGKLRLDTGLELVRAKSALEAVGELSDLVAGGSTGNVVIVASDADPATHDAGQGGSATDAARAKDFIAALRQLDPAVRILRLEGKDGGAPHRAGYDGLVSADATAEALRAVVRGRPGPEIEVEVGEHPPGPAGRRPVVEPGAGNGERPEHVPDREMEEVEAAEAPGAAPVGAPSASAGAAGAPGPDDYGPQRSALPAGRTVGMGAGDEGLVRLLLQGRDILDAAVATIRERLAARGGRDIVYVSAGPEGGPVSPAEAGAVEASVSWRGRLLGRLRARQVTAADLQPMASWLASWLALRDQHAQLRDAAFTDSLTGASNRRFFDNFLGVAIEQARQERRPLTLLMFDIDDFKQYNDRYGHAAGDEILTETVRLLRSVVRPSDKVCRIGGDEFVVIFHEPTGPRVAGSRHPSDIFDIAQRFQREVSGHKFPKLGREAPGALTVSGGLATYPWDGNTPELLLAFADSLALQSKRQGKNVITLGPGAEREHGGK